MREVCGFNNVNQHEWNASTHSPDQGDQILTTTVMKNQAFATSGSYGTVTDGVSKFTHLFDPRTGRSQPRYKSVSVIAGGVAVTNAFSATFSIMDEAAIRIATRVKSA